MTTDGGASAVQAGVSSLICSLAKGPLFGSDIDAIKVKAELF